MTAPRPMLAGALLAALILTTLNPSLGYAASLVERDVAPNRPVALRSGTLAGPDDDAGLPARLRRSDAVLAAGGTVVVRLTAPVGTEGKKKMARVGLELLDYLGDDSFVARTQPGGLDSARGLSEVDWIAPYHPGLRIAPEIAAVTTDDERAVVPVTLQLFPDVDVEQVASRLASLGIDVKGRSHGRAATEAKSHRPGRIVFLATPENLIETREIVSRWPETMWIGARPVYRLLNDNAAWVGQSGLEGNQATPVFANGLHGEGQTIAVLDTGVDADSCWFYDTALGLPPINQGLGVGSPDPAQRKITIYNFLDPFEDPSDPIRWDSQNHGTHVAGSASGDHSDTPGIRDSGDGQAPAAKLVIQDAGYAPDDCGDLPALGCPVTDLYPFFEQAFLQGARIHSNSYGDAENITPHNTYSEGSEAADSFMWDHPEFLLLFAAGNNGPLAEGTVGSPATAKNILSIGGTGNGSSANLWYGSTSVGPTHDDRIKPDLMAPGSSIYSAANDMDINSFNCSTRSMSGTSMASPTAAGYTALAREYYMKGYYPSGSATPGDAFTPSAALLKATMIVSGTWMEHEEIDPLPSYEQGWGRILLDDALYFPGDDPRLWVTDVPSRFTAPGDMDTHQVQVLDGAEPLRVILNWTDYPSNPAASINLVNDLDLEVQSPTGDIYKGNLFVDGVSQIGGSHDDRNTTEGVRIEAPQAGTWTIRVKSHAIPQASQGYGLVVTGRIPAPVPVVERSNLVLDTSVAGNPGGTLAPGGWVDAQVELWNTGGMTATNAYVTLESLTDNVVVERAQVSVADIGPLQKESTGPLHLRFRIRPGATCPEFFSLRFGYFADGWGSFEEETYEFGSNYLYTDDFEDATSWHHVAGESDASVGDWIKDDPIGTDAQPEDDVTPDPGHQCLFTAQNPGASLGNGDVDAGLVVARSGAYDLSGHPEARLRLWRWFTNWDTTDGDTGDYYQLKVRENSSSSDVILEEIDHTGSATGWTEVEFRLADFVTVGSGIEFSLFVSDGTSDPDVIEAAIDELAIWEAVCDVYDPEAPPYPVDDLRLDHDGTDVVLDWTLPRLDPAHSEATRYEVYRSVSASAGFTSQDLVVDSSLEVSWTDTGALDGPSLLFYKVIAENDHGSSE